MAWPPFLRLRQVALEPSGLGQQLLDPEALPRPGGSALLQREASLELLALQVGEGGPEQLRDKHQAADDLYADVGDTSSAI